MADPKKFDEFLDSMEETLLHVQAELKLKRATIERWRWDEPDISLRWYGADGVGRNIHAWIEEQDEEPREVAVEANAWRDEDQEEGKVRVRHWENAKIGRFKLDEVSDIHKAIWEASSILSGWTGSDLKKTKLLSPSAL